MQRILRLISLWGPAAGVMVAIFALSSQPAGHLPNFGPMDYVFKKTGHVLGYGVLGLAYWRGLKFDRQLAWRAWILAVVYAATDEFHQSFVAGRNPSLIDALVFDGGGAALALYLARRLGRP